MLNKLMITTAAAALAAGAAFAQAPSDKSTAPKMETQAPKADSTAPKTQQTPMTEGQGTRSGAAQTGAVQTGSAQFVTQQTADQMLASKFRGTDVLGQGDEKIGDVSDILFDMQGKVDAYIVGVGGFLGIGAKDVAIAPAAFQLVRDDRDNIKLKLAMSKDDLKNAPEFKARTARQAPTTGQGGDRNRAPANPPAKSPSSPPPSQK